LIASFAWQIIALFKQDVENKLFRFLHIPAQSGNNEILKAMNRYYTAQDFINLIKKIRTAIPSMTISTDIIVGFPGETDEQFQDSIALIKEIKPDVLNRSRYSPRPKTLAAALPQLHGRILKERSRLLTQTFDFICYDQNKKWKGWQGSIVLDEKGKEGTDTVIGRNYAYKPVIVENKKGNLRLGDSVKVKIIKITRHDLRGEIVE